MSQETVTRFHEIAKLEAARQHARLAKVVDALANAAKSCHDKLAKDDYSDMRFLFAVCHDVEKAYHEAMTVHAVASHMQSLSITLNKE